MAKKIGDRMSFTGGAELTPTVEVIEYKQPYSMRDGEPTLVIRQGKDQWIVLSPDTMRAILRWYEGD